MFIVVPRLSFLVNTPQNGTQALSRSIQSMMNVIINYIKNIKNWQTKKGNCTLDTLTLRRISVDNVERLELVDAAGTFHRDNGQEEHVGTSDLELVLHPMSEELNWQESTILEL